MKAEFEACTREKTEKMAHKIHDDLSCNWMLIKYQLFKEAFNYLGFESIINK